MQSSCLNCPLQQTSNYFLAKSALLESFSLNGVSLVDNSSIASGTSSAGDVYLNSICSDLNAT